jgi:CheY-like chemotaxis protein
LAENGLVAISKARDTKYDIILMDLQMPVMDGYSATKQIRGFNELIPIIALTASASTDIQHRVSEFGMTDYLPKPFRPNDLFDIIFKYTSINKAS